MAQPGTETSLKQSGGDVHDCSVPSDATWKTAEAEECGSRAKVGQWQLLKNSLRSRSESTPLCRLRPFSITTRRSWETRGMAALNTSLKLQSNHVIYPEALHKIFAVDAGSFLQLAPRPLRPVKIAVIGNHLPRQCGIATFTTDLCDAISAVYGAAQLSVVAVNDGQSSYTYPERVRFEIREGDLSRYPAPCGRVNFSGRFPRIAFPRERYRCAG